MISVLIAYSPGGRAELMRWAVKQWREMASRLDERLEVILATAPADPWRKGLAYWNGLRQAEGDVVIFTDCDVSIPLMPMAIAALRHGTARWVKAVDEVIRLSPRATLGALSGDDPGAAAQIYGLAEQPYSHDCAGAGTVLWRSDARVIPVDPRFAGWGHEDRAWNEALSTLLGPAGRVLESPCFHLWHEPQERLSRTVGSHESLRLERRYRRAAGDQDAMRALVAEASAALPHPLPHYGYLS